MLKQIAKTIMGYIRCTMSQVQYTGGVYVGRHVHFVNGRNIDLGRNVQIRPDVDLFASPRIMIGNNCDIGTRNRFDGNIVIGNSVLFGPDNYISSNDHAYKNIAVPVMNQGTILKNKTLHNELLIGEDSWIGTHVAVIGCVHIGKHCVIGANAVVTNDVPDYSVVVGNPARIVKQYSFISENWKRV